MDRRALELCCSYLDFVGTIIITFLFVIAVRTAVINVIIIIIIGHVRRARVTFCIVRIFDSGTIKYLSAFKQSRHRPSGVWTAAAMFARRLLLSRTHFERRWTACPRRALGGRSPALETDVLDRIVYSSVLQSGKAARHWRDRKESSRNRKRAEIRCDVEPVSLRWYLAQEERTAERAVPEPPDAPYSLPYGVSSKVIVDEDRERCDEEEPVDDRVEYDREWQWRRTLKQQDVNYNT